MLPAAAFLGLFFGGIVNIYSHETADWDVGGAELLNNSWFGNGDKTSECGFILRDTSLESPKFEAPKDEMLPIDPLLQLSNCGRRTLCS